MKNLKYVELIVILTLIATPAVYSQINTLWTNTFGGINSDYGYSVN